MSPATTRRAHQRRRPADPSAGFPHNWPFGPLTETQIRARSAFEAAMRQGRLAPIGVVEQMAWTLGGAA